MTEHSESTAEQLGQTADTHAHDDVSENEVYHSYSVDDEDQPQDTGDSLTSNRGLAEPLDEGFSPPRSGRPARATATPPTRSRSGSRSTSA